MIFMYSENMLPCASIPQAAMQLILILCGATSKATDFIRPISAALLAAYKPPVGLPVMLLVTHDWMTIDPPPFFII